MLKFNPMVYFLKILCAYLLPPQEFNILETTTVPMFPYGYVLQTAFCIPLTLVSPDKRT